MCNEATLNRIVQTVRELPEASAVEVLDFAQFLQARKAARAVLTKYGRARRTADRTR